ncbi:MAG TPA: BTAD domain-containing putative transcriptional regulator, partial [Anaerolineales bacterium]|nr:BTAD domain-containing putative transcriptional regulator [Anaerolineales bacterium]
MLEVRLLGQFDVKVRGVQVAVPYRGAPLLLAYLILNKDVVHSREKLAGILWPDSNEANARANLRRALYQLRRVLKAAGSMRDYFLSDDLSIGFDSSSDYWLDVAVLEQRLGGSAPPEDLARAAGVYRSEFLPGYYDSWVLLERERLQAVFERRMHALLDSLVAARRWPEVLEWGERWIATGQVPEPAYRALMVAHAALGDAAGIASVFQRSAEALRRELGVEPSEQTRSLYAQLVRGDRPAVATAAPSGGRATTEGARETARHGIEAEGAVESRTTMPIVD